MLQQFRRGLEDNDDPTPHDTHEQCRQRILDAIRAWTVPIQICMHCGTKLLMRESSIWCCGNGTRIHHPWDPPARVLDLYRTPRFGENSRLLNSLFTPAVLYSSDRGNGLTYHYRPGGGPPAMRISGQMYVRFMRPPQACWFVHDPQYDSARLTPQVRTLAERFREILRVSANPFAQVAEIPRDDVRDGSVSLCVDGEQQTLYAVFVGPGCLPPERYAYHIGSGQRVSEESPLWEIMVYPIFHPLADMRRVWQRGYTSTHGRRLTLLNYLKSVMLRDPNYWLCHRLAHQHVLDTWARNEQQLAKVWRSPVIQERIRAFVEQSHGRTALFSDKIYLPASVPGSFRYQQRLFHDALYISSKLGNPHLFLTMTANTHWPEVRGLLRAGESARNRLDAIARAFVARRQRLIQCLETPGFLFPGHLGVVYVVYVTEWQLCGLPHLHLACRLRTATPLTSLQEQLIVMDTVISAQYPRVRGHDYDLVESFMTHNDPCRVCLRPNPRNGCQECRFHYPKPVSSSSFIDAKGFPVYKRTLSDTRVVPHNLKLLRELGCHLNAEWTYNCGCVAYLYKYLTKGYDAAGVRISDHADEIAAFRRSRIMSAGESTFRSLGFDANYRNPAVILCKFSLPPRRGAPLNDEAARRYTEGDPDLMHEEIARQIET